MFGSFNSPFYPGSNNKTTSSSRGIPSSYLSKQSKDIILEQQQQQRQQQSTNGYRTDNERIRTNDSCRRQYGVKVDPFGIEENVEKSFFNSHSTDAIPSDSKFEYLPSRTSIFELSQPMHHDQFQNDTSTRDGLEVQHFLSFPAYTDYVHDIPRLRPSNGIFAKDLLLSTEENSDIPTYLQKTTYTDDVYADILKSTGIDTRKELDMVTLSQNHGQLNQTQLNQIEISIQRLALVKAHLLRKNLWKS